ncbi:MAG TPA: HD domain-containing protein [Gemmatimonadaceae bacterium]|nr:HD domain-containing protein [Gemmatimonadaceae bacterium]
MASGTFDIARAQVGDRVQHEFLVVEREEKRQASGDPFVVLTLGNATGRLPTAPIWSSQLDWALGADKGKVVQVIGDVAAFHGKRQLRLTAPLRVLPDASVRPELFLPRIPVATEPLWDWIDRARAEMKSSALRRAVDLFYGDEAFRLEFERAPASVGGHHAAIGGLLLHVTEVATIARNAARVMKANADLVVAGALLHDIGKLRAYDVTPAGFTHTPAGSLVGHVVLGALMLQERLATVSPEELSRSQRLELLHLILSHHGALEFGSPVQPMTVEAELLHWADETSAKANDMGEALGEDEHFGDGEVSERRPWRVGRRIWRRPHSWD